MERSSRRCPAGSFLDGLGKSERTKLDVIFQRLGDTGVLRNPTKFKKVEADIWAVKSGQIRIFCFFTPDQQLVLAFGIRKKSNRHSRKDVRRAIDMRAEFFEHSKGGRLNGQ